jgi:thymidylate synthase
MKNYPSFGKAWMEALSYVHDYGEVVAPRGMKTMEVIGYSFTVTDALQNLLVHPGRDLNFRYCVAEFMWITAGLDQLSPLVKYNKRMAEFSDDGYSLRGAYGPRLMPQMPWVIAQLKLSGSRQAVATIWTPTPAPSKDIPCTISAQFLARAGKVHAVFTMRSSDLWLGLPYDFYVFSQILNCVAGELGLEVGSLTMQLGSAHLYETHWSVAREVLDHYGEHQTVASARLPGFAPAHRLEKVLFGQGCWEATQWCELVSALHQSTKAKALEVLRAATR